MNEFDYGVLVGFLIGGLVMFVTCAAWALWAMSPAREIQTTGNYRRTSIDAALLDEQEDEHARAHGI